MPKKPKVDLTREQVESAFAQCGTWSGAAALLGVSESALHRARRRVESTIAAYTQPELQQPDAINPEAEKLRRELEVARKKIDSLTSRRDKIVIEKSDEQTVRFGLIGDLHFGSLYQYPEALRAFYEYAAERGVRTIYVAGDILDGHRMYRGQEFEVYDLGLETQLDRFRRDAPRIDGVVTQFITGNHDASFTTLAGAPVGRLIAEAREDWLFLGEDQAQIEFHVPKGKFSLRLLHPSGGTAYALSYQPQKKVEALAGGTKPNMLAIGHYHKAEMIPSIRNVCAIQTGTFQKQTRYMATKGLEAHLGGWLVEVTVGEKQNAFRTEYVAFY